MKTTIELAKECGADFEHANSEIVTSYDSNVLIFSTNAIEAFRKACIADYKIRCEQVGEVGYFNSELVGYLRSDIKILPDTYLFTLPNNG